MKIKVGDKVKVITGHYKGTIGEVKAVGQKSNNFVTKMPVCDYLHDLTL